MKRVYILFVALAAATVSFSFTSADQDAALKKSMEDGKGIYQGLCMACHLNEGQGIASVFPPIAKSDYLMADLDRSIEIIVNGKKYNGVMPAPGLDDKDIADVLNYVRNSWGNKGEKTVTVQQVAKVRAKAKK
jgi:mono/diheme cytochrome c family protein